MPLPGPPAAKLTPPKRGKPDKTHPTAPADRSEQLIMASLADPEHRKLTVTQRCELVGVSRSTWYERMDNPVFRARASRTYRRLCDEQLSAVLDALSESAKLIGREGHQDRKLFLELLGEYAPGVPVDEQARKPGEKMTDQELLEAFAGRPELLPVGVRRRMASLKGDGGEA